MQVKKINTISKLFINNFFTLLLCHLYVFRLYFKKFPITKSKNFFPYCLDCPNGQKSLCVQRLLCGLTIIESSLLSYQLFPLFVGCFSPDLTKVQKVQGQSQQICNISKQSLQKYVVCINTISITTTFKIGKVTDQ